MTKHSSPLVSVITPTYNRASLLAETIESILGQSYGNFEYIIIDDGSKDNTKDIVSHYKNELSYHFQENQGEPQAVNAGWKKASGDYFACVSSDDPVRANWLSTAIDFMEKNPDIIVGYPDWQMIDVKSNPMRKITCFDYSRENMIAWMHCVAGPGTIIRKSALKQLPEIRDTSYRFMSDFVCWLRLSLLGDFARIPYDLATWRYHDDAITVRCVQTNRALEVLRMHSEFFQQPDLPESIKKLERRALGRAFHIASVVIAENHPYWSHYYKLRADMILGDEHDVPPQLSRPKSKVFAFFQTPKPRIAQ